MDQVGRLFLSSKVKQIDLCRTTAATHVLLRGRPGDGFRLLGLLVQLQFAHASLHLTLCLLHVYVEAIFDFEGQDAFGEDIVRLDLVREIRHLL